MVALAFEVRITFLIGDLFNSSFNTDLPLELGPPECHASVRIFLKVLTLPRGFVVAVPSEAAFTKMSQKYDTR